MEDFTQYIRIFYQAMSFRFIDIKRALVKGDMTNIKLVRHIILNKLLKELSLYDNTSEVQRISINKYREIQTLLNNYLQINNTYNEFYYSPS